MLIVERTPGIAPKRSRSKRPSDSGSRTRTFARLLGFLRPYKVSLAISVVLAVASQAAGMAILLIDKDVRALIRVADVHYMLEKGRVVWSGDSAQLSASEDVQHRYLGV